MDFAPVSPDQMKKTVAKLKGEYQAGEELAQELDEDTLIDSYPDWLAKAVLDPAYMSLYASGKEDFENLYFWDDDYDILFENGFIPGIRRLISGAGGMLGYGYENATEIFTDIGLKAPKMLVGTQAAYEIREEIFRKQMSVYHFDMVPPVKDDRDKTQGENEIWDEEMPFT